MQIGEIKKCEEYNKEQLAEWHNKGTPNNLACYVWLNNQGNFKRYGYVGMVKTHSVLWAETKKELIARMKKEIKGDD